MGVDTQIYCRIRSGMDTPNAPSGASLVPISKPWDEDALWPEGATHEVRTMDRFYAEGYERGCWPHIAAVLMELISHLSVETVWYGGDSDAVTPKIDEERVVELCRHWMRHRDRPYRYPEYHINAPAGRKETDVTKHSLEMQVWWRDHQEADRQRVAREVSDSKTQTERNAALSKLTPYERRLLGL